MIPKGYEKAAPGAMPDAKAVAAMMKYNESLQKAGVLHGEGTEGEIEIRHRAIDAVFRTESAKLIAGLARIVRDVGLAEDLAQDVLDAAIDFPPVQLTSSSRD